MNFQEFKEKFQRVEVTEFTNSVSAFPLVSICIQTYQQENYISECIEGALNQKTDFPFEILIGEDDSTDKTREICIHYAKKHPDKIRLFLHARKNNVYNMGKPSSFFNIMYNLYNARGKYFSFCEGDDYWSDLYKIQKQADILENNPGYNGVYTNFKKSDKRGKIISEKKYTFGEDDILSISNLLTLRTIPRTLTTMYRNLPDVIQRLPDFYKAPHRDKCIMMLFADNSSLYYLDDVTAVFRYGSGFHTPFRDQINGKKNVYLTWQEIYIHFKNTRYKNILLLKLNHSFWKYFRALSIKEKTKCVIYHFMFRKEKGIKMRYLFLYKYLSKRELPASLYRFRKI